MKNNYIKLFANCIVTKGASRSIVCDLQRTKFIFIPNSLADLFAENQAVNLTEVYSLIDDEDLIIFMEYIELLEVNELIFYCSEKELNQFPLLSMEWDYPATISNIIIDASKNSNHNYEKIINYLPSVNCRYIQIRFYDEVTIETLKKILVEVNNSFVQAIEFIVKDNPVFLSHEIILEFVNANKKIRSFTIHSSSQNKLIQNENYGFGVVFQIKQTINSSNHCGIINNNYFSINIESFTESQHHNSCLNRKISIDTKGNIKNCPSMNDSFGNIENTSLEEAVNHPNFKKYWDITKDQIDVCKDCEFRHICTDCRAFIEEPDNKYSNPLKCGYSPYTNEWEEWSTNPLKQKAITYYGMQELVQKDA